MKEKILFINDYLYGGGAEVVFKSTYEFFSRIYDCSIFYGTEKTTKPKSFYSYIYSKEYETKLWIELNNFTPDIIHLHNFYHLLTPSILNAIKRYKIIQPKVKVIMTIHDYHLICPNSGYTRFSLISKNIKPVSQKITNLTLFFSIWDRRGFIFSTLKLLQWFYAYKVLKLVDVFDLFISPSEFLKNEVAKYLNTNATIVRNFFPKMDLSPMERNNKKIQMVFVGRISEEKGLLKLLKALKEIKSIPYIFDIIGEGEQLPKLLDYVKDNSMDNEIKFHGRLPHDLCMKFLQNVNTLVLPSLWYENAPLSLVEGAFSGLRLLTMNVGGMKEIGKLCGNEYLIELDYSNFNEIFLSLFTDIKDNSFKVNNEVEKIFSQDNYIHNLRNIYDNLL